MKEFKQWLKQLFCKHDYRIRVTCELGVNMMSDKLSAVAKDGAKIDCSCIKCDKTIATSIMATNGKLVNGENGYNKKRNFLLPGVRNIEALAEILK